MSKKRRETKSTNITNLSLILLIGVFILFTSFSAVISLLYVLPTYEKTLPVSIHDRDSHYSSGGLSSKSGGSSGFSYSITFLTYNGNKIKTSATKAAYDKALSGFDKLDEMTLTLSKFFHRPVALNIRSKSIQYSGILNKLIPKKENTNKSYSLIYIPFIGALLSTVLLLSLVIYMILKAPHLSRLNRILHFSSYLLFTVIGVIMAI